MSTSKKQAINKLLAEFNRARGTESHMELVLIGNLLIREQVRLIYEKMMKKPAPDSAPKFSSLLSELINQPVVSGGSSVKIARKKNLKAVKLWKGKFDTYYKDLKRELPGGTRAMAEETMKIAAMLQTTILKL